MAVNIVNGWWEIKQHQHDCLLIIDIMRYVNSKTYKTSFYTMKLFYIFFQFTGSKIFVQAKSHRFLNNLDRNDRFITAQKLLTSSGSVKFWHCSIITGVVEQSDARQPSSVSGFVSMLEPMPIQKTPIFFPNCFVKSFAIQTFAWNKAGRLAGCKACHHAYKWCTCDL